MNSDGSNNLRLKYQRFTPSGYRDIGIRKLGFVAKTQFLSYKYCKSTSTFVITRSIYATNFCDVKFLKMYRLLCFLKLAIKVLRKKFIPLLSSGRGGRPTTSISSPNHIEILVLSILFFLSVRSLKINTFFKNMATLGHR